MMIQKALHRIRPRNGLDNRFLYYSLLHQGKTGSFAPLFTGATIRHLPGQNLAKVELAIPPLTDQRRIADVLSAYDDLIENNRRRIRLLEQAARLLYEEWFVRLRFPRHGHVTTTDRMPEGWERKLAAEVIEINPRNAVQNGTPIRYVPMGALSTSGMVVDLSESQTRAEPTPVRFMNGDTLLARITPCLENGKTGYVNFLGQDEIGCGSTEFVVLRGQEVSSYFTYCLARTREFRATAIKSMVGSSGRQRVQVSCLREFVVSVPPASLRKEFDSTCEPLFRQITVLIRQIEMLAKARDFILPRLMNGEVVV
ncbi:MAG: restriction endonuclease subunit S [Acidobacteria bacterium]|nr:restriction endonuclease subunit S [Acidobacteriota bacterium]